MQISYFIVCKTSAKTLILKEYVFLRISAVYPPEFTEDECAAFPDFCPYLSDKHLFIPAYRCQALRKPGKRGVSGHEWNFNLIVTWHSNKTPVIMQAQPSSGKPDAPAGQKISLKTAIERARLFRDTYMDKVPAVPEEIKANAFSREIIMDILNQPGCTGIRIYHSVRPEAPGGPIRELILIGTDKDNKDLLTTDDYPSGGKPKKGCNPLGMFLMLPASPPLIQDAVLAADPRPCPNMCGVSNPVNGSI